MVLYYVMCGFSMRQVSFSEPACDGAAGLRFEFCMDRLEDMLGRNEAPMHRCVFLRCFFFLQLKKMLLSFKKNIY